MICKSCGQAGDTVAIGRDLPRVRELSETLARIYHSECEGCDCQHRLGPAPRVV